MRPAVMMLEGRAPKRKGKTETGAEGKTSHAEPGGEKEPRSSRSAGLAECEQPKEPHAKV